MEQCNSIGNAAIAEATPLDSSSRSAREGEDLTPPQIVAELDKYIISQNRAKRAVAIALRNRWRRMRVEGEMRKEITPKNILMIGPTGVGKTEISRRLAKLAQAPFVKVEASKFTEVGYVGRDVDSIVRDLAEASFQMVREQERQRVRVEAEKVVEEKLLNLLLPSSANQSDDSPVETANSVNFQLVEEIGNAQESAGRTSGMPKTRERFRELLRSGKLEGRSVDVEVTRQPSTQMQILGPQGFAEIEGQIKEMFSNMVPKQKETRKLSIAEARKVLLSEAQEGLIDHERVAQMAVERAEQTGIVFIDEIDKVCGGAGSTTGRGPDVSREGVQRDLLPIVEGSTVGTKYGPVKTDHVLFIASGAFHTAKPSDLMPEFQGRFPIRVELDSLGRDDFIRILTEPQNALIEQYRALMATEGVELEFSQSGIEEIAELAVEVNSKTENIGARRLHTLMERVTEEISYEAASKSEHKIQIDREYVRIRLAGVVADKDLSRFIL